MGMEECFDAYAIGDPDTSSRCFYAGWNAAIKYYKVKVEAEDNIPYRQIMDGCNGILGKNFKITYAHKAFIKARWNEGFKVEDFWAVCRIKHAEWDSDPKMRLYLRPETLFGTKMDSYINQEVKSNRQVEPSWL